MRTNDDIVRQLTKRGWAEALWAHHPPEVKAAIREMRWRPQVKQCFANCQRLALSRKLEVEYREGWIQTIIPIQHAWLVFQGKVLEMTLDPGREVEYLDSYPVSMEELALSIIRRRSYGPVYPKELDGMNPLAAQIRQLRELSASEPVEHDELSAALRAHGLPGQRSGV